MKVSSAKIRITSEDILDIIEEYVEVEGLKIKTIELGELITVMGSYKKGVEIPFKGSIGFGAVKDNIINVILFDFKIAKLGILAAIKRFALKNILKDLQEYGITVEDDNITIDLKTIVKLIPYVDVTLKSIGIVDNAIEAEVEDIKYEPNKETLKFKKDKEKDIKEKLNISDGYAKLRDNIQEKVPDKYKTLIEYAMLIPDIVALLWRLFKDKRVNKKTKALVGALLAYIASPLDIIPDFIPLIGKVDDIAIVLFAMNKIINEVPEEVILSNWTGDEDIIKLVKNGVALISKMVGGQNVGKLLDCVKKLTIGDKEEKLQEEKLEQN